MDRVILLACLAVLLVASVEASPPGWGHGPPPHAGGPPPHHREPGPICMLEVDGEVTCNKTQDCPDFTTCLLEPNGTNEGIPSNTKVYSCMPKICQGLNGAVEGYESCPSDSTCDYPHRLPYIKVCRPNDDPPRHPPRVEWCRDPAPAPPRPHPWH